ncbi:hypothetical protein ABIE50_003318 [Chitinophaga sp. OAE865]
MVLVFLQGENSPLRYYNPLVFFNNSASDKVAVLNACKIRQPVTKK